MSSKVTGDAQPDADPGADINHTLPTDIVDNPAAGAAVTVAEGAEPTAGTGTAAGNLAAALPALFSPAVLALIRLVIARDELRARLRAATGTRLPLIAQATARPALS